MLTNRSNLTDAAGVWAWDLLEAARDRWHVAAARETFGQWLRQHEANLFLKAAETFVEERRRLIGFIEFLEVR